MTAVRESLMGSAVGWLVVVAAATAVVAVWTVVLASEALVARVVLGLGVARDWPVVVKALARALAMRRVSFCANVFSAADKWWSVWWAVKECFVGRDRGWSRSWWLERSEQDIDAGIKVVESGSGS